MKMSASGEDQFRAALDRALSSDSIRHSSGLCRLLSYLGERALGGEAADLKEYTIGLEAFHKPEDYDPQQDPSVRVLASKLRHRLEDYYLKEGVDDPFRIDLPKGHFELKLHPRAAAAVPPASVALSKGLRRWRLVALTFGICSLLLLAINLNAMLSTPRGAPVGESWTPELELLWAPYLKSSRPILIAIGTPLFTKFSGGFFRDPRINLPGEAAESDKLKGLQEQLGSPYAVPWYGFTGTGEATGAFLLGRFFNTQRRSLYLQRSSGLKWDDLRHHDVIFLGSPKFNPQLEDLPARREFIIQGGSIVNLHPLPGEQETYGDVWSVNKDVLVEDFALVSRLPGLHARGEIMVLASSSSQGTWAATEYVTQPAYASEMVGKLMESPGEMPKAFQVLIRIRFQDHVPTEIKYVTHRVLDGR